MENLVIGQAKDNDKVRTNAGYIPELCLVASIDEEIVGHILLSKASIGNSEGLALGPL